MFPRVGGAVLALAAAAALALAVAMPADVLPSAAWWSGHPEVMGRTITAKTVHIGPLMAKGCNTGGDGDCENLSLGGGFTTTARAEAGVAGLLAVLLLLMALTTLVQSESRKTFAKLVIGVAVVAGMIAGAMIVQGPDIQTTVKNVTTPIGYGMFVFWGGVASALLGSVLALQPARAPKRRAARPSRTAMPRGTGPAAAMASQPLDVHALFQDDALRPSSLNPAPPIGGMPTSGTQPLFSSAPQLRPLYDAAPGQGGTGGFVPQPQAPPPMSRAQLSALTGIPTPPPFDEPESEPSAFARPQAAHQLFDEMDDAGTAEQPLQVPQPVFDPVAFDPTNPQPSPGARPPPTRPPFEAARPAAPSQPPFDAAQPPSEAPTRPSLFPHAVRPIPMTRPPFLPGMPPTSAPVATPPPPDPTTQPLIGPMSEILGQPADPPIGLAATQLAVEPAPASLDQTGSQPTQPPPPPRAKAPSVPPMRPTPPPPPPGATQPASGARPPTHLGRERPSPKPGARPSPSPTQPPPRPSPSPTQPPPRTASVPMPAPKPGPPRPARPTPGPGKLDPSLLPPITRPPPGSTRPPALAGKPAVPFPAPGTVVPSRATTEAEVIRELREDSVIAKLGRNVAALGLPVDENFDTSTGESVRPQRPASDAQGDDDPDDTTARANASPDLDLPASEGPPVTPAAVAAAAEPPPKDLLRRGLRAFGFTPAPTRTTPQSTPPPKLEPDPEPQGEAKVPLSTAPESLPPPSEKQSATSGPSPACPQCESPMAWVEAHLRFYCKSCKMYF